MRTIKVKLIKSGRPNDTKFVLGATGCGKTTLIATLAGECPRAIIFDTKQDYPESFFPGCAVCNSKHGLTTLLNKGYGVIIVQLWHNEDMDAAFDECCKVIMQWHTLNPTTETTFVLDEMNNFCGVNQCSQEFKDIIMRGRSVGIKKLFGASWFGTIPTWARDTFTEIYTFRHTDENGLERLEIFGFDQEQVRNLPDYHCMYSGKGKIEMVSLVPDTNSTK